MRPVLSSSISTRTFVSFTQSARKLYEINILVTKYLLSASHARIRNIVSSGCSTALCYAYPTILVFSALTQHILLFLGLLSTWRHCSFHLRTVLTSNPGQQPYVNPEVELSFSLLLFRVVLKVDDKNRVKANSLKSII